MANCGMIRTMSDFEKKLHLKEMAEEDIYFARRDRELIEALRRKRLAKEVDCSSSDGQVRVYQKKFRKITRKHAEKPKRMRKAIRKLIRKIRKKCRNI